MEKVKALLRSSGDRWTLFLACQLGGKGMDIASNDFWIALGYVSTLGAFEGSSSLLQKARSSRFEKYGLLTPGQVRALPLGLKRFSKTATSKWFELPLENRRELVAISEGLLLSGSEDRKKSRTPFQRLSIQRFGVNLSIRVANFISRKNVSEEILKALYQFADDILNQSVQDEAFRAIDFDLSSLASSQPVSKKRRRAVIS
jgi:hypothetical protein